MNWKVILLVTISIIIVLSGAFLWIYFSSYNDLVMLEETANEKWAQVEQELQRRYDLIPAVVNASRIYIEYEGSILEEVTGLRSQWGAAMTAGDMDQINNATGRLDSGLSRLIVVFEDYPELKASQIVEDLMIVLEGTENRISTERMRYNEAAGDYNRARRFFPANLWTSGWGFEAREYFEAKVGVEDPPPVPVY